jgi:hypothetical protein
MEALGFSFNGELSENLTMDHSRLRLSSVRLPARYWHLLMISKKITSIVAGTEKNNIRLYHLDIFFSASLKSLHQKMPVTSRQSDTRKT